MLSPICRNKELHTILGTFIRKIFFSWFLLVQWKLDTFLSDTLAWYTTHHRCPWLQFHVYNIGQGMVPQVAIGHQHNFITIPTKADFGRYISK